jgi:hypothetical protein
MDSESIKLKPYPNFLTELPSYTNAILHKCRPHQGISSPAILSHLWSSEGIPLDPWDLRVFSDRILHCLRDCFNGQLLTNL